MKSTYVFSCTYIFLAICRHQISSIFVRVKQWKSKLCVRFGTTTHEIILFVNRSLDSTYAQHKFTIKMSICNKIILKQVTNFGVWLCVCFFVLCSKKSANVWYVVKNVACIMPTPKTIRLHKMQSFNKTFHIDIKLRHFAIYANERKKRHREQLVVFETENSTDLLALH